MIEYTSEAPAPLVNMYPRLAKHLLLPDGTPDYLRLILNARVYDLIKETPLVRATNLSAKLGNEIWLKREDLQEVFSFKVRGAYNFMAHLCLVVPVIWRLTKSEYPLMRHVLTSPDEVSTV